MEIEELEKQKDDLEERLKKVFFYLLLKFTVCVHTNVIVLNQQ